MDSIVIVSPICTEVLSFIDDNSLVSCKHNNFKYFTGVKNGINILVWCDFYRDNDNAELFILGLREVCVGIKNAMIISFIKNQSVYYEINQILHRVLINGDKMFETSNLQSIDNLSDRYIFDDLSVAFKDSKCTIS